MASIDVFADFISNNRHDQMPHKEASLTHVACERTIKLWHFVKISMICFETRMVMIYKDATQSFNLNDLICFSFFSFFSIFQ